MTNPTWRITWSAETPDVAWLNGPGMRSHPMHPRDAARHVLRHGADDDRLIWLGAGSLENRTTVGAYRAVVRRRQLWLAVKVLAAILLVLALAAPIAGWL